MSFNGLLVLCMKMKKIQNWLKPVSRCMEGVHGGSEKPTCHVFRSQLLVHYLLDHKAKLKRFYVGPLKKHP